MARYLPYEEYLKHPLFRIARDVAFQRARGICEICHAAPASDAHHKQYPVWGTFDTPSNILALCHACHCKVHNKENGHGK
jgi:hypothetical protein